MCHTFISASWQVVAVTGLARVVSRWTRRSQVAMVANWHRNAAQARRAVRHSRTQESATICDLSTLCDCVPLMQMLGIRRVQLLFERSALDMLIELWMHWRATVQINKTAKWHFTIKVCA